MKKLLALVALICLSSFAYAETKFSVGGGLNLSYPDFDEDLKEFDEEVSADLNIGGKVEIDIQDSLQFRTGLWLQEKSAKISYDKDGIDGDLTINTVYASVPLTLQYMIQKNLGFFGGYSADIRINDYCSADGDFDNCTLDDDTESVVHNVTAGMAFVVNAQFGIDVSLQRSITDVYDDGYKLTTAHSTFYYRF